MRILMALALFCAHQALAEEIVFANGDRLSGTPSKLVEGSLTVESELAGTLTVPFDQIVEIRAADGLRDLEELARDLTPPEKIWSGSLQAGASFERGNSESDASHAHFAAERRRGIYRLELDAGYTGQREVEDSTGEAFTANRNLYGGIKLDRFVRERIFVYGKSRAERDGDTNLSLRTINGTGLGWQIRDRADSSARVEVGVSWVREEFKRPRREDDFLAGSVGWKLERLLRAGVKLFHDGSWYPSFEDERDHLIETATGLRIPLMNGLYAESRLNWTWDSTPATDKERQDTEYILSLGYEF